MADTILTDDTGQQYSYENIKTQGWLDGHEAGLDQAVEWLNTQAVSAFKAGDDSIAISLRQLAKQMRSELEPAMKRRAAEHERDFPGIVNRRDPSKEAVTKQKATGK
jgi:hypothetical protein